jgi:hypothetical protein
MFSPILPAGNFRRLRAAVFAVAFGACLGPPVGAQMDVAVPIEAGAPAANSSAAGSAAWNSGNLFSLVLPPRIFSPSADARALMAPELGSLERVLMRTGLTPGEIAALPVEDRAVRAEAAVTDYARGLAAVQTPPQTSDESLSTLSQRRAELGDAAAAVALCRRVNGRVDALNRTPDTDGLLASLHAARAAATAKFTIESKKLLELAAGELAGGDDARWRGRTAVVALPDGSEVALKFAKGGEMRSALEREGDYMERARAAGLDSPIPLPQRLKGYTLVHDGTLALGDVSVRGLTFLPYLIPKNLAAGYFEYLGEPLRRELPYDERRREIENTALKGIDDMLTLRRAGFSHTSLAPISHSQTGWRWDFWRWKSVTLPGRPFGPTALHDWKTGLSHSNLRATGITDFEHLVDSIEPRVAGQNLTEWALLVMRGGQLNGLTPQDTSRIVEEGLLRHASGALAADDFALDPAKLAPPVRQTVRHFYGFTRLASMMPRWAAFIYNVLGMPALLPQERGAPMMPGPVVYPLIMNVIWPYTEALAGRVADFGAQHASVVGSSTLERPSKSEFKNLVRSGFFGVGVIWSLTVIACIVQSFLNKMGWMNSPNSGFFLILATALTALQLGRVAYDGAYLLLRRRAKSWISRRRA